VLNKLNEVLQDQRGLCPEAIIEDAALLVRKAAALFWGVALRGGDEPHYLLQSQPAAFDTLCQSVRLATRTYMQVKSKFLAGDRALKCGCDIAFGFVLAAALLPSACHDPFIISLVRALGCVRRLAMWIEVTMGVYVVGMHTVRNQRIAKSAVFVEAVLAVLLDCSSDRVTGRKAARIVTEGVSRFWASPRRVSRVRQLGVGASMAAAALHSERQVPWSCRDMVMAKTSPMADRRNRLYVTETFHVYRHLQRLYESEEVKVMLKNLASQQVCGWCRRGDKKLRWCEGCHAVAYCSRRCQKLDWGPKHGKHRDNCH